MNQLFQRFTHSANFMWHLLRKVRAVGWSLGDTVSSRRGSRAGDRRSASKGVSEGFRKWSCLSWWRFFREGSPEGLLGGDGHFSLESTGEKPLSANTSGRSVPVGSDREGKSRKARTRVTHLESNTSFWLDHSFYFKGKWALWKGFHWELCDLFTVF